MKAINILWDIDGKDVSLPSEIEIPEDIAREGEEAISD